VPLVCTVTVLLPWPGDDEAVIADGPWVPHVDPESEQPSGERLGVLPVWGRRPSTALGRAS